MKSAADYRADAAAARERVAESWERSDTDGFLSQWAGGLTARLNDAKADIADRNGKAVFPALFRNGELVAAKLIDTKFGRKWGVLASDDPRSAVTKWFAPTARAAKKWGYTIGEVLAPANAKIDGKGYGLSGSAWVVTYRTDGGFSRDVDILTADSSVAAAA